MLEAKQNTVTDLLYRKMHIVHFKTLKKEYILWSIPLCRNVNLYITHQCSPMIIGCKTPFYLFLTTTFTMEPSMLWGSVSYVCWYKLFFAVILSFGCKHLQLFTVKCPLCSPSLPVCFQHYSTCHTYCIVLPYCSIQQREVIGRVTCEVVVSREKN